MTSGFVALIGRPNAGKSTLLNQILDRKIAIVSDKPQTTRNRITGIYTTEDVQIVFVDTPGIHKPKHKLGEYMVETAEKTLDDVDLIYYLVDASVKSGTGEEYVLNQEKQSGVPVFLLLNKVDKLTFEEIGQLLQQWQDKGEFAEIFPLSALQGDNVARLVEVTEKYLPEGPQYYPEDAVTDQPLEIVISELIREKALRLLSDEIPHGIAVTIEKMTERKNGMMDIEATIVCERDSHKGIIIGKGGAMLKRIGSAARREIEDLMDTQVNLQIWVKVRKEWRDSELYMKNYGYNEKEI